MTSAPTLTGKAKAAPRRLQGGKGRVHRGPTVGSRPGAPCRRTQPGSASRTQWGATSKQQRGKRGCAQSKRAEEKLQKAVSKTSFHGLRPSRGLPARAPDCGAHTGEPSEQSVAHTWQLRRGMDAHPGGRRGSRQVRPLGAPARPAPSGRSAARTEEGTPRTRGSRAQAGRSP